MNRPNRREVLECGGWRGMGLTPLFASARTDSGKALCALTPHPPQSKTLARQPSPRKFKGANRGHATVSLSLLTNIPVAIAQRVLSLGGHDHSG